MNAAVAQCHEAGITDSQFLPWLASVNFQLGAAWNKKLFGTWALIVQRRYAEAADHEEMSLWAQQTPVRADDFARALKALQLTMPVQSAKPA
jgi:hypothetical protein